jgi:hypothetical protein
LLAKGDKGAGWEIEKLAACNAQSVASKQIQKRPTLFLGDGNDIPPNGLYLPINCGRLYSWSRLDQV